MVVDHLVGEFHGEKGECEAEEEDVAQDYEGRAGLQGETATAPAARLRQMLAVPKRTAPPIIIFHDSIIII